MKNFIAFDFETANRNRHSICSVGIVFVENGEIVDSVYQLIDPEEPFDGFNTAIHGIRASDVKGAPKFNAFYNSIKNKIENKVLVAHYLAFDGYALRDNLKRYAILPVRNELLCTYQLSKRLVKGQSSYSIKSLCNHFGIKLHNHHHALDDAKACAELMVKLSNEHELHDLDSIYLKSDIKCGEIKAERYRSSRVTKSNTNKLNLVAIEVALDADQENTFYGKNIVFTGKLNALSRKEAATLVASQGGTPQNGINANTDYIIIGNFDDVMIKGNKSSKLVKAEKLIEAGNEIEIISEENFLKML